MNFNKIANIMWRFQDIQNISSWKILGLSRNWHLLPSLYKKNLKLQTYKEFQRPFKSKKILQKYTEKSHITKQIITTKNKWNSALFLRYPVAFPVTFQKRGNRIVTNLKKLKFKKYSKKSS